MERFKSIVLATAVLLSGMSLTATAQQSRKDIHENWERAGSNYLAYPGPQRRLTATPKGYEPYYLSHYGRHGSRYMIGVSTYDHPYEVLHKADSLGVLTAAGRETLRKAALLREEARGRDGELTELGAVQHRQIARRMMERFPEIFRDSANIDAKSTVVIRCILSMENALQELVAMNPKLKVRHDASYHDMYYMNQKNTLEQAVYKDDSIQGVQRAFWKKHSDYSHLMGVLFTDPNYVSTIDVATFGNELANLALSVQETELRHELSLRDLFTEDEIYDHWQCANIYWYITFGPSPLTGGRMPFSQRNLLRKIISEADSCLQLDHPGATLRYGHDTMVMPLTCLLGLNGTDKQIADLEQVDDEGWRDYTIFPMACNLQLVFYKKKGAPAASLKPDDILVKVLLNEDEAKLPIKSNMWPYYRWSDVKRFCINKLAQFKEK